MSPSAAAPSRASIRACSSTSPSECATTPRSCAIVTPPSRRLSPGPKRCTSKPKPILIGVSARREARPAASARSAGRVTLTLSGDPSTRSGFKPSFSIAAASSVASNPSASACVSACTSRPCRNICGVCARQSRSRGSVRWLRPSSSACFRVSATGTREQPAHGVAAAGRDERLDILALQAGTRRVVHQHPVVLVRRDERLQAVQHGHRARRAAGDRDDPAPDGLRQPLEAPVAVREHGDAARDAGSDRIQGAQAMLEERAAGDAKVGLGNRAAVAAGAPRGGDHEPDAFAHPCVKASPRPAWNRARPARLPARDASNRRPGRRSR